MVLPQLIRYVLLLATRQSTVKVSLSALAAVVLLYLSLLSITAAGDFLPPVAIQCPQSKDCESGQNEEQASEKERNASRSRVQGEGGIEAVNVDHTISTLVQKFHGLPNQMAEWKQQIIERTGDVFGGVAP